MIYNLPKQLLVDRDLLDIRSDFRAALDIITALSDPNLTENEKEIVFLKILYVEPYKIINRLKKKKKGMWFLNGGENDNLNNKNKPQLMDWEQDFRIIISPINRVLGYECRERDYLHWWTFLGAYMEIGECTFSTVCRIRAKQAKHQKLEKYEKDYLKDNYDIVILKKKFSDDDKAFIDEII